MKASGKKWWACLVGIASFLVIVGSSSAADALRTAFRVDNLSCGSCLSNIGAELQTLPGALGMDADLGQRIVVVDHKPSLAAEEIATAMTRIGYPATTLSTVEVPEDKVARQVTGGGRGCGGGGCGSRQAGGQAWAPVQGDQVTSVFKVDNLSCSSCLITIGGELQRLPGTIGLDADLATGMVYVDHQPSVDTKTIAAQITGAGYPASYVGSGKKIKTAQNTANGRNPVANGEGQGRFQGAGGCNSRGCGATASSWQQLYQRYFANQN